MTTYRDFVDTREINQLLIGNNLDSCLLALDQVHASGVELHIVERINMSFIVQNAILNVPNLTRFKISGDLPQLRLNFSDNKYSKSTMP
jgi:vacuolar protein sorting-associated protein 13A/C